MTAETDRLPIFGVPSPDATSYPGEVRRRNGGFFPAGVETPQQWVFADWARLLAEGVATDVVQQDVLLLGEETRLTETKEASKMASPSEGLLRTVLGWPAAVIAGSAAIIGTLIGVIYLDMRGDIDSIRSSTSETAKTLSVLTTRVETGFAELSGKLDVTNTKLDNLQRQ
jgi:hypothetical protein